VLVASKVKEAQKERTELEKLDEAGAREMEHAP